MAGYSVMTQINSVLNTTPESSTWDVETSRPQNLSRYFGGHSRTSHPYVNGYWQFFVAPPCHIFSKLKKDTNYKQWFHATAEGFTPPSRNLNKADLPGQGGVASSWITGQSLMRTFSITHREYRDLPVLKMYELWTSAIVPQLGISEAPGMDWEGHYYKGHAFVILTKPTASTSTSNYTISRDDIEEVFYFDGVWPENVPTDALAQDISSNDIVQYTINYSFDGWPLTKTDANVVDDAVKVLSNWKYQNTYQVYQDDLKAYGQSCV